jgi:ABC-type multidrug transport system fused ATPase/permease subunit
MVQLYISMRSGFLHLLAIALVVVVSTDQESCVDNTYLQGDEQTSLLQTFTKVRTNSQHDAEQDLRHVEDKASGKSEAETKPTSASAAASSTLHGASMSTEECVVYMPFDLRILHHGLRAAGLAPPDEACNPGDPMFGMLDHMLAQVSSATEKLGLHEIQFEDSYFAFVPMTYILIMTLCLGRMLWYILHPAKSNKPTPTWSPRRPEAESWQRGYMNWLFVDWVSEWIDKWGNVEDSDTTKISSDDLQDLGDPDDEVAACYDKIRKIWDEEVQRVGLQKASMFLVIARFVGWHKLCVITLWSTFYETCMFLGPPISMAWVIRYIEWLYVARFKGQEITNREMIPATLVTMVLFQGLPAFIAISNSISTMLGMRISIRVCGGLSSLIFQKAQRLPHCSLDTEEGASRWDVQKDSIARQRTKQPESEKASGQSTPSDESSGVADDISIATEMQGRQLSEKRMKKGDGECGAKKKVDEVEPIPACEDDGDEIKMPTRFNLVQLVANDVGTHIVAIPLAACRLVVMVPICMILFGMLYSKIHATIFFCAICCALIAYGIFEAAASQIGWVRAFYFYAGKRLTFIEDMFFNIRTVKAFGWEGIMEERIAQLRNVELEVLWGYYKRLGIFYGLFYQFPRIMILVSLWGYTWFYGADRPVNIFATIPILFTFQSAFMNLMFTVPEILNAKPSLDRIEQFMKLPEAPVPRDTSSSSPPWVDTWPERQVITRYSSQPSDTNQGAVGMKLRIQGSFKWRGQTEPILKDLNLCVPVGMSIAVLGKVGSGKSSLLNAIIGELYPVGDARISIPSQVAYSGQVPYICEGTLKDNILFGEPYDENRYNTCIFAASLFPDIQVLPGGDEVPIGSRGISLSGGQRARVSMARAAYCSTADVVLIDDPFGSVDSRTARHLLDEYVHGAVLRGRTKIVVCQPDPERIREFDRIVIMNKGRIAVEGTPREVMQTNSYQNLLNHHQKSSVRSGFDCIGGAGPSSGVNSKKSRGAACQLREEEYENRPDWKTVWHFLYMGGVGYLSWCIGLFMIMMVLNLMMCIVLQNWASDSTLVRAGLLYPIPTPNTYLWPYLAWWGSTIVVWIGCWICGMIFTTNLSKTANLAAMRRLLHAPIDRFYDRTPVGRIMNRMSTDLSNIDVSTFNHITHMISIVWTNLVPLVYLHFLMPVYFTCACIPFYYLMFLLFRRFWNTMIPMRYLTHVSKSHTDTTLTEVDHSNSFVRGCRKGEFKFQEFQRLMKDQIKADVTTTTFLKRWLVNRLFLMMGFFVCSMVLIAIWVPNSIAIGGIGLCLTNMFQMIVAIEQDIDTIMKAQFQFISMKRLHDYATIEQEADFEKDFDIPYKNYCVRIRRNKLGTLQRQSRGSGVVVVRQRASYEQVILQQSDQKLLMAPEGFKILDPGNPDLKNCKDWHRLVAVNGKGTSPLGPKANAKLDLMIEELCSGKSNEVVLQIHSGWLLSGARLTIKHLTAGYGEIRRNVLKEISFDVLPCTKVGIVGTTGCGKSTLLLCLLRILEPKSGQILLNGVDTKELGLKTLRTTIGMVPQDPVLMQCSIRGNLDPFAQFDDEILWRGLDMFK